jgi:protein-disulfide isomerase
MHDALFDAQGTWSGQQNAVQVFKGLAGNLGLDQDQFDACLDGGTYAGKVNADLQEGVAQNVTGTPAFRINGIALSGAQPFSAFQQQLDYLLAGGEAPSLEVEADSFRSLGSADAPVVVTEFSDYQCPYCATTEQELIPELIARYVDTGQARFVYREFPLDSIHPNARLASEAAVCAGKQQEYWAMHELLFARQSEWSADAAAGSRFKEYARELGLGPQAFDECLDTGEASVVVQGDVLAGESLGVNATPYFFVGEIPIRGGQSADSLGQVIEYVAAGGETPQIVPVGNDWRVMGNQQTARAITVAFVDYSSPLSGQHALEVLPTLMENYIETGQLVYVLHPWSSGTGSPGSQAAIAAECSGEQGKYWEMHDSLFEDQDTWLQASSMTTEFTSYAESLGLDTAEFEECLQSSQALLRTQAGNVVAALYGVPGAPVFLFNNGQGTQGSPGIDEFTEIIDSIINQ